MIELIIIVAVVVALVAVGIYLGNAGNSDPVTAGDNTRTDQCRDACIQWQDRKGELCDAERAEADAKERADTLNTLFLAIMGGTIGIVTAALGAAAVLALLSEFGVPAVIAAAIIAGAAAVFLIGAAVLVAVGAAAVTAHLIWTAKQQDTADAEQAESGARVILNRTCTQDEIAACTANSPC